MALVTLFTCAFLSVLNVSNDKHIQTTHKNATETKLGTNPGELQRPHNIITSRSEGLLGEDEPIWQKFVVTWYSPQGGWESGTITRTGTRVAEGTTIAVDPRIIPLGSRVAVRFNDGTIHVFTAEDTGSAIRGTHIDIFMWDEQQCIRNGREILDVCVIHKGE